MVCCYPWGPELTTGGEFYWGEKSVFMIGFSGSFGGVKTLSKIWPLVCKLECHETHNELLIHPFAVGFADCAECVGSAHQGTATATTAAGYERDFDYPPYRRGVDSWVENPNEISLADSEPTSHSESRLGWQTVQ
jgi:hypothetical protein